MAEKTESELRAQYEQIRDETNTANNTATRVGQAMIDGLDSYQFRSEAGIFLPYRIERSLRSGKHLDVSDGNNQKAFFVAPDGSRFFMIENGGGPPFRVEQWGMSTPGDLVTATLDGVFDHGLDDATNGISFNSSGTRMYILDGTAPASVNQFNLDTPWNIVDDPPTSVGGISVAAQTTSPITGPIISPDGTKILVSSSTVTYEYNLSIPDEVIGGSMSYSGITSSFVNSGKRWANGIDGTPGGLLVYSTGTTLGARTCPTPYSINGSSADALSVFSPGISTIHDLHFVDGGNRMWLLGPNDIYEYYVMVAVPA